MLKKYYRIISWRSLLKMKYQIVWRNERFLNINYCFLGISDIPADLCYGHPWCNFLHQTYRKGSDSLFVQYICLKMVFCLVRFMLLYTVPKAILWKEMFICTVRNVYQVLKKCFFTANHLAEKENFVLYIRNVCHTIFLSLQRNFSLPSSPLTFRAKSLLLSLFW